MTRKEMESVKVLHDVLSGAVRATQKVLTNKNFVL